MSVRDEVTREWVVGQVVPVETDPEAFDVGQLVGGKYRVQRAIGQGGMGSVVEVVRIADGRLLALKFCRAGGPWRKRFEREVRLMARVKHPNVVPVLDADLSATPPYFVMPLADGSLEDELPWLAGSELEALAAFHQACLGVQAIHGSGTVHRDIKPANLLRFRNGRVAVSDLGVAKADEPEATVLTRTRTVVGTYGFLAPEQFLPAGSRRADVRTDVYQLGKVLYRLLTGESPILIEPAAVPKGLFHVLSRATSSNPEDRYEDLGALLDALRYYELSKDPARNSREALENLVLEAEAWLGRGEYRSENVREILALLEPLDRLNPIAAVERFDRLPDALLPILARDFPVDFAPVLRGYAGALRSRVATFKFGYADILARRMRKVFFAADHADLKALALEITLVAAVALNRFAAMGVFNRLLMSVRSVEIALPVAEMLRARLPYYSEVARGAPPDRLHPAIRDVRKDLLTTAEVSF